MRLPIPKGIERRLPALRERGERLVREWEWTWTSAFVAGVAISFVAMTTLAIVPSWWLFYADEQLEWRTRFQITIRDLVVLAWLNLWGGLFVITAYKVQVLRRRLRGERQAERYAGGYR